MAKKLSSDISSTDYFASAIASNYSRSFYYLLETSCEVYDLDFLLKTVCRADKHLSRIQKLKDVLDILCEPNGNVMVSQTARLSSSPEQAALPLEKGGERKEIFPGGVSHRVNNEESSLRSGNRLSPFLLRDGSANISMAKGESVTGSEAGQGILSSVSSSESLQGSLQEDTTPKQTHLWHTQDHSKTFSLPPGTSFYPSGSSNFLYLPPAFASMIRKLKEKDVKRGYLIAFLASGFTSFLIIKRALVCALREVAELYGELSYALRYWRWAPHHRIQHFLHCGLFVPFLLTKFTGFLKSFSSRVSPPSYSLNMLLFSIRNHLRVVVSLIGGLFSLLYRAQSFFDHMQERVGRRLADPAELSREMHQEILQLLSGVKSCFEESRDHLRYTTPRLSCVNLSGELNFNLVVSDTEWDYEENEDQIPLLAHIEKSQRISSAGFNMRQAGSSKRISLKKAASPRFFFLSIMKCASDVVEEMYSQRKNYSPPLLASHGRLVLLSSSLLTIILTILLRFTPEDLYHMATSSSRMGLQLIRLYCVFPAKSIAESLLYSRPGVDTRIAAFHKEAKALAQTITEYHADYVTHMNRSDLEQLHRNTYDALIRGDIEEEGFRRISDDYLESVRYPLRGVIYGHLPRLLLIRMSIQALEITRVVNGIDEVLDSNRLNFQAMTIIPLFAVGCFCAGWFWWKWRRAMRPVHLRLRRGWREAHRILNEEMILSSGTSHAQNLEPPRSVLQREGGHNFQPFSSLYTADSTLPKGTLSVPYSAQQTEGSNDGRQDSFPNASSISAGEGTPNVYPGLCFAANQVGEEEELLPMSNSPHLSNYEQGLLLLSVHEMRIATKWFLQNYNLYEELLDDLEMIENNALSRHQRLEVLCRMRMTHKFL